METDPIAPERLTADDVTGGFGANGALAKLMGRGHTSIARDDGRGTQQTMSGDKLDAHLAAEMQAQGNRSAARKRDAD